MKCKLLAGAALAAVFSATGAAAQVGWYGAVDLGYHWPETTSFDTSAGRNIDVKIQDDWAGFARLGYQLNKFRTDAEGRIALEGLVPGVTYRIVSSQQGGRILREFTVRPGETVDLKDVKIAAN